MRVRKLRDFLYFGNEKKSPVNTKLIETDQRHETNN